MVIWELVGGCEREWGVEMIMGYKISEGWVRDG